MNGCPHKSTSGSSKGVTIFARKRKRRKLRAKSLNLKHWLIWKGGNERKARAGRS